MKDLSLLGIGCMAAPVTGSLKVTGTWTATGDGKYTDATVTTGEEHLTLAAPCLNISGTITTCDRVGGPLSGVGYESATCVDAASGGCTCVATVNTTGGMAFPALSTPAMGTFTTASNVITATDGRNEEKYSYCVSGNTLTVTPQSMTTTGSIVLEKQ